MDLLRQAIELDPDYAMAHALFAEACAALFNTGHLDATWLDKAQQSLDRAESLDPSLPDLRVARARIVWTKTFNFPAETALRELRWALTTDPDHVGALRLWATITSHVGLFDLAEAALERRRAHGEPDPVMAAIAASLFIVRGEPERSLEILEPLLRMDPNHDDTLFWWVHGHALTILGRVPEARLVVERSLSRHPQDPLNHSLLALVQALEGQAIEARRSVSKAESTMRAEVHPHHAVHLLACAKSVLGELDDSLELLGRAASEGMPCWPWFKIDPFLENARNTRAGEKLLADMKRRHDFFRREFPNDDEIGRRLAQPSSTTRRNGP